LLLTVMSCGGSTGERPIDIPPPDAESEPVESKSPTSPNETILSILDKLPPELEPHLEPWTGDLDGMLERGLIRILTAHNPMLYTLDGARQRGIVYEAASLFERALNQRFKRGLLKVSVIIIPLRRDRLLPALVEGLGDLVAANLTITPPRLEQVDFSIPVLSDVSEIVVSGPSAPSIENLSDLAGRKLTLRESSSYWTSVERLNEELEEQGLAAVRLSAADPHLEDHDLLEMVNAGLLDLTVVDSHKARFWAKVLDRIVLHSSLTVREGGAIGWAIRKESPQLREVVNDFVEIHRKGTLMGNILFKRYLEDTSWVTNAYDRAGRDRLEQISPLVRKYARQYDFDWLLLVAQGFQESGLDQTRRSRAGAIGLMQVLPGTARQVGIDGIEQLDNNLHAGTKYLRHLVDHYFADGRLDAVQQHHFALAAYNAGPTRIRRLRQEASEKHLDPDIWFDNVEVIVARRVGSETVQYVRNIRKYFFAYKLLLAPPESLPPLPPPPSN